MKKAFCFLVTVVCFLSISVFSYADSVTLPSNLTEIGEEAFYGDTHITEVTVSDGATTIGPRAFANSGLQTIHLPASINSIDETAFDGLSDSFTIQAPSGSVSQQYAIDNNINWQEPSTVLNNDFMRWMLQQHDTNGNGILDEEEISAVISINCEGKNFASLEGIELFINLRQLDCDSNRLSSLDLSGNTSLRTLHCAHNRLTSLTLNNNSSLQSLYCFSNRLSNLDISNNTSLRFLECDSNRLTNLDMSHNGELSSLYCSSNQLTTLDVSCLPSLKYLTCNNNKLTNLILENNLELTNLSCSGNQLTSINIGSAPQLTQLTCSNNQLTTLDTNNNSALTLLNCSRNHLESLNLSNNLALRNLNCYGNQLSDLNLRNNINLLGSSALRVGEK